MSKTKAKTDDVCQVRCFNTELVTQLRENLPSEEILEEMTVIFGALADRSRVKILYALRNGDELCVCDIAAMLVKRQDCDCFPSFKENAGFEIT